MTCCDSYTPRRGRQLRRVPIHSAAPELHADAEMASTPVYGPVGMIGGWPSIANKNQQRAYRWVGTTGACQSPVLTLKRKPLAEYLFDYHSLVVLLILGAVHQRHVAAPSCGNQRG